MPNFSAFQVPSDSVLYVIVRAIQLAGGSASGSSAERSLADYIQHFDDGSDVEQDGRG